MARLALILIYPLLVLGRALNALLGRDPMRLREPEGSFWIERPPPAPDTSYFSEESPSEGLRNGGFGWLAARALRWAARPFGVRDASRSRSAAERDKDIPDEVYTLW